MNPHRLAFVFAAWLAAPATVPGAEVQAAPARTQVVEPRVQAPGRFDGIVVVGAGQVRLFQADRDEVVIPGDRRLIDAVGVSLAGSDLTITLPRNPALLGHLAQVEVHVSHLRRLTMSDASNVSAPLSFKTDLLAIRLTGTGWVAFDKLEVGQLAVDIAGTASGRLAGKADRLQLSVSGRGTVAADHLRARRADVSVAGAANADVWAVDEIALNVADSGHVQYWGEPGVKRTLSGQGSIESHGTR